MNDETKQPQPPGSPGPPGSPNATPPREIYGVEPESPAPKAGEGSLLAGFDEDADFERDPEVELAKRGPSLKKKDARAAGADKRAAPAGAYAGAGAGADSGDGASPLEMGAMSRPGKIPAKHLAIAGGVGVIAAAILAGVFADAKPIANAIMTGYMTLLVSLLGLAGVAMASALLSRPIGAIEHAAARMLFATALASVIVHIRLNTPGKVLEVTLALAGYYLAVWVLFRLRPAHALAISCCHAMLAILMFVGTALTNWASQVGTTPPTP